MLTYFQFQFILHGLYIKVVYYLDKKALSRKKMFQTKIGLKGDK